MGKNENLSLTFHSESVILELKGKNKSQGTIEGGHEFNKILLRMYMGKDLAPSHRFRKEILGIQI